MIHYVYPNIHTLQDRQRTYKYKRRIETRSRNYRHSGKAVSIAYSELMFVVLVKQHTKSMRCITLSAAACLDVLYFSTLSHKQHDFQEKVIDRAVCILVFSTIFI